MFKTRGSIERLDLTRSSIDKGKTLSRQLLWRLEAAAMSFLEFVQAVVGAPSLWQPKHCPLSTAMSILNHASIISHNGHGHFSKLRVTNAGLIRKAGIGKKHVNKSRGRGVEGTKSSEYKRLEEHTFAAGNGFVFFDFVSSSEGTSFMGIFGVGARRSRGRQRTSTSTDLVGR